MRGRGFARRFKTAMDKFVTEWLGPGLIGFAPGLMPPPQQPLPPEDVPGYDVPDVSGSALHGNHIHANDMHANDLLGNDMVHCNDMPQGYDLPQSHDTYGYDLYGYDAVPRSELTDLGVRYRRLSTSVPWTAVWQPTAEDQN